MLEVPITFIPFFYAVHNGYTFSEKKVNDFLITEENDDNLIEV